MSADAEKPNQPNIVLIVSDEERRTDWLDGYADLPGHDRLAADGISFDRYYTHSSPCSPSRASLYTGQYLWQHGVVDNVSFPAHHALPTDAGTIGSLLSEAGYDCGYVGKWHLSHGANPDMEAYGYGGWQGDDVHFTGNAYTGRYFDPIIAQHAIDWLEARADSDRPWCLTIALVNPHDIMWFPIDQPDYLAANPEDAKAFRFIQDLRVKGLPLEPPGDFPRRFDRLPDNFDDDLHTKPEVQRAWRHVRNREHFTGAIEADDTETWLRGLDYYAWLHEELDRSVSTIIAAMERLGIYDDSVVAYTADHGDACGSHGLRAKLPCIYEEVMGVPLIVKMPGTTTPGTRTDALASSVDLAATLIATGGVDLDGHEQLHGVDLTPTLADPQTAARDHILLAQDSAQSPLLKNSRYALRGYVDADSKYARYYGIGGGIDRSGAPDPAGKLFDVDAAFDDHDHEWYDTVEDPLELHNVAADRSRRAELRESFERLREYERLAGG